MQVKNFHGKTVVDSREVAAMVEKNHKDLLRDIRGYINILKEPNERKIAPVDFFIESNYEDSKGEMRFCYLITKKGCDLIAHKLTGRKGVLFSAAYITAFEEMQQALSAPHYAPEVSPNGLAKLIAVTRRVMLDAGNNPQDIVRMTQDVYRTWNVPVPCALKCQENMQLSLFETDYLLGLDGALSQRTT